MDRLREATASGEWEASGQCPKARSARAIAEPIRAALFVPLEDLVAGLARYTKLPAQRSHAFAVLGVQ
jgi:hypothetical protein